MTPPPTGKAPLEVILSPLFTLRTSGEIGKGVTEGLEMLVGPKCRTYNVWC